MHTTPSSPPTFLECSRVANLHRNPASIAADDVQAQRHVQMSPNVPNHIPRSEYSFLFLFGSFYSERESVCVCVSLSLSLSVCVCVVSGVWDGVCAYVCILCVFCVCILSLCISTRMHAHVYVYVCCSIYLYLASSNFSSPLFLCFSVSLSLACLCRPLGP